jgi:pimeloyl-ACP methyl ester carboxylesterase
MDVKLETVLVLAAACVLAPVLASYAVEALRSAPTSPAQFSWGPGIAIEYVSLDGIKVRYLKTGSGPNLVLLHTLRTQLDIFEKVIPQLAAHFTVYAYDYPGHGWSDIPQADYAPEDFYGWTAAFLDSLRIEQASVVGISIGGTISLVLAARHNPRIARTISINPYDYPPDGGIRRSSLMARLILGPSGIPILGATLMRLRGRFVSNQIMEGGVASPDALSQALLKELYDVGDRRGHFRGFLSLLAHEHLWSQARSEYPQIDIPTLLVYGERDWAPPAAREQDRRLIPDVTTTTIGGGGHFLSLDRPREVTDLVIRFVADTPSPGEARS